MFQFLQYIMIMFFIGHGLQAQERVSLDGDSYADLVIGVPLEDIGSIANAGSINVLYNDRSYLGLQTENNQGWHQNSSGIEGDSNTSDYFGMALAIGDFNADGYADVAVGAPSTSLYSELGTVNIIFGTKDGLSSLNNEHFDRNPLQGLLDSGNEFAKALAVGDFNGDTYDDLAIGVPNDDVNSELSSGSVNVVHGSSNGMLLYSDQLWHQDITDVEGTADQFDHFGGTLCSGDFNGDGFADLAIGSYGENDYAGAVNILYGTKLGLSAANNSIWDEDVLNTGESNVSHKFGLALASGDLNNDGYDDLAVGTPYKKISGEPGAGNVNIIFGSQSGLTTSNNMQLNQSQIGSLENAEEDDKFGASLAIGDFNYDGYDDVAVGVPYEDYALKADAGLVHVFFFTVDAGSTSVLREHLLLQDDPAIEGDGAAGDHYGMALAAAHFANNNYCDLAIGIPRKDVNTHSDAGAVNVHFGAPDSFGGFNNNYIVHQDTPDIEGMVEDDDRFGSSLAAFRPKKRSKIKIGAPLYYLLLD